jgi:hypothetical protein
MKDKEETSMYYWYDNDLETPALSPATSEASEASAEAPNAVP